MQQHQIKTNGGSSPPGRNLSVVGGHGGGGGGRRGGGGGRRGADSHRRHGSGGHRHGGGGRGDSRQGYGGAAVVGTGLAAGVLGGLLGGAIGSGGRYGGYGGGYGGSYGDRYPPYGGNYPPPYGDRGMGRLQPLQPPVRTSLRPFGYANFGVLSVYDRRQALIRAVQYYNNWHTVWDMLRDPVRMECAQRPMLCEIIAQDRDWVWMQYGGGGGRRF